MKLRGHHLICLHFFKGEGYSSDFVANLQGLIDRAEEGEEIEVIDSADDVCRRCPHLRQTICCYQQDYEAQIREMDSAAFELLRIGINAKTEWGTIRAMLPRILEDWSQRYCFDCNWKLTCRRSLPWTQLNS